MVAFDEGRTSLGVQDVIREALDYLLERTEMYLERKDKLGLIVADRPGGGRKQENELLESVLSTIEVGTDFVQLERIPLNILTTPSHLICHLQIADLVVGIATSMVAGAKDYAEPLFPLIKKMLIRNAMGYIGGAGLKLFPDDLLNLYHWVLGESTFVKTGMGSGWGLPLSHRPYGANEWNS